MKKNRYEMCGLNRRMKKLLFVMKLTILAFFLGLMSLSASTYSQNKKITLDLRGVTLWLMFLNKLKLRVSLYLFTKMKRSILIKRLILR